MNKAIAIVGFTAILVTAIIVTKSVSNLMIPAIVGFTVIGILFDD